MSLYENWDCKLAGSFTLYVPPPGQLVNNTQCDPPRTFATMPCPAFGFLSISTDIVKNETDKTDSC